jgi:hypothetical protein
MSFTQVNEHHFLFARYARSAGQTREPGDETARAGKSTRRPASSQGTPRHMKASQSGQPAVGALSWRHCGKGGGHPSRRRQGLSSPGSTVLRPPKLGSEASSGYTMALRHGVTSCSAGRTKKAQFHLPRPAQITPRSVAPLKCDNTRFATACSAGRRRVCLYSRALGGLRYATGRAGCGAGRC